jgi:hypothetical protein
MNEAPPGVALLRPVPWYYRGFSTWVLELRRAGLLLVETSEPPDPATGRPVSLILNATIPERRRRPEMDDPAPRKRRGNRLDLRIR